MNNTEKEFYKIVRNFCKEKNIPIKDLKNAIRTLDIEVSEEPKPYVHKTPPKALTDFHSHLVKEVLDFLRDSPEILKEIEDARERIDREWNKKSDTHQLHPDVRIEFSADSLLESLSFGSWTPTTDSYLGFSVGGEEIMGSM